MGRDVSVRRMREDAAGVGMTSQRTRARMVEKLRAQGISDERVLEVMGSVPRHVFVDAALASRAYEFDALPIGFGQTISHPFVVASMLERVIAGRPLAGGSGKRALGKVLEVGTGCGYQAALLAGIAAEAYSIERIKDLHELARANLRPLRLPNLRLTYGDGRAGLEQAAPFDAIVVAAAGEAVPPALLRQLATGGRMILPVRPASGGQHLLLVERRAHGFTETVLDAVKFVPLETGKA
jgi:protein-L-isoaspartate(D-aspartate) O-methyltransferase